MIELLEAVLVGAFAAVTLLYTFQTKNMYPDWMLQSYEHPWVFLILLLIAVFIAKFSPRTAVMMALLIVAMWMDGVLFVRPRAETKEPQKAIPVIPPPPEVWPFDEPSRVRRPSDFSGPALESVPFVEPMYPTFMGTEDLASPGPSPFLLS